IRSPRRLGPRLMVECLNKGSCGPCVHRQFKLCLLLDRDSWPSALEDSMRCASLALVLEHPKFVRSPVLPCPAGAFCSCPPCFREHFSSALTQITFTACAVLS